MRIAALLINPELEAVSAIRILVFPNFPCFVVTSAVGAQPWLGARQKNTNYRMAKTISAGATFFKVCRQFFGLEEKNGQSYFLSIIQPAKLCKIPTTPGIFHWLRQSTLAYVPERISHSDESVEMNASNVPDDQGVEQRKEEPLNAADHRVEGQAAVRQGGRGHDQEEGVQEAALNAQVEQEQISSRFCHLQEEKYTD